MNKYYEITTTAKEIIKFKGHYRRDLEKPNWHYYEDISGNIIHFRKEHMVSVIEREPTAHAGLED